VAIVGSCSGWGRARWRTTSPPTASLPGSDRHRLRTVCL